MSCLVFSCFVVPCCGLLCLVLSCFVLSRLVVFLPGRVFVLSFLALCCLLIFCLFSCLSACRTEMNDDLITDAMALEEQVLSGPVLSCAGFYYLVLFRGCVVWCCLVLRCFCCTVLRVALSYYVVFRVVFVLSCPVLSCRVMSRSCGGFALHRKCWKKERKKRRN